MANNETPEIGNYALACMYCKQAQDFLSAVNAYWPELPFDRIENGPCRTEGRKWRACLGTRRLVDVQFISRVVTS